MEKIGWQWRVCQAGITWIKSEDQILYIMEKSNWHSNVCKAGMQIIKQRR